MKKLLLGVFVLCLGTQAGAQDPSVTVTGVTAALVHHSKVCDPDIFVITAPEYDEPLLFCVTTVVPQTIPFDDYYVAVYVDGVFRAGWWCGSSESATINVQWIRINPVHSWIGHRAEARLTHYSPFMFYPFGSTGMGGTYWEVGRSEWRWQHPEPTAGDL